MKEVFGQRYANVYDSLYASKDYEAECDLLESIFNNHSHEPVRSILDMGCGTGNHAFPLASRGYHVVGVDRSADMVELARSKSLVFTGDNQPRFEVSNVTNFQIDERFDAAMMMFAVLGYQHDNESVIATLTNMRRHLKPGGLAMFDVWYGPVVLSERPSDRQREISRPNGLIIRSASSTLDIHKHLCHVTFDVRELTNEGAPKQMTESHTMRYFFPRELDLFLHVAGFSLIRIGQFPDFDLDPNDTTWNVMVLARSV